MQDSKWAVTNAQWHASRRHFSTRKNNIEPARGREESRDLIRTATHSSEKSRKQSAKQDARDNSLRRARLRSVSADAVNRRRQRRWQS